MNHSKQRLTSDRRIICRSQTLLFFKRAAVFIFSFTSQVGNCSLRSLLVFTVFISSFFHHGYVLYIRSKLLTTPLSRCERLPANTFQTCFWKVFNFFLEVYLSLFLRDKYYEILRKHWSFNKMVISLLDLCLYPGSFSVSIMVLGRCYG